MIKKFLLSIIFSLILLCDISFAGFDLSSNSGDQSGVNPFSWTHTTGSLTSGMLFVVVHGRDTSSSDIVVSGITFNGDALTKAREDIFETAPGSGTFIAVSIWYIARIQSNFSGGIEVTYAGTVNRCVGTAVSWNGIAQVSPVDSSNTGNKVASGGSTTVSATVTTVNRNVVIVNGVYNGDGNGVTASDGGQTTREGLTIGDDAQEVSTSERIAIDNYTEGWTDVVDDFATMTMVAFKKTRKGMTVE